MRVVFKTSFTVVIPNTTYMYVCMNTHTTILSTFFRKVGFAFSSDEEEEVRVVRSLKDKRCVHVH